MRWAWVVVWAYLGSLFAGVGLVLYWAVVEEIVNPAAENVRIQPVLIKWRIGGNNWYRVTLKKHRDCRLIVYHIYTGPGGIKRKVLAPSFRRVRTTGKFRVHEFLAVPPSWMKPGIGYFEAEVHYSCNPLTVQVVRTNRVRVEFVR